jgi:hypothetical protein
VPVSQGSHADHAEAPSFAPGLYTALHSAGLIDSPPPLKKKIISDDRFPLCFAHE